ncbi:MAG: hypothetical protein ABII71_04285 [Candidatus Micrarchaeota archaeon]
MDRELKRQIFHLILGFVGIAILYLLGRNWLMAGTFFMLLGGLLIINRLVLGWQNRLVRLFLNTFERKEVLFPGWGVSAFAVGVLIIVASLESVPEIAAGLFVLGVGDSFSTIIGRNGRIRLPYNKRKTAEGMVAFFITSLPAYYFVGPAIVPVALAAAIIESLKIPIDDNLTIPVVCTLVFLLIA